MAAVIGQSAGNKIYEVSLEAASWPALIKDAYIDLDLKKEVKNDELVTKCKWSPFDGWKLKGWPTHTIVNGNIIFENGNINKINGKGVSYDE